MPVTLLKIRSFTCIFKDFSEILLIYFAFFVYFLGALISKYIPWWLLPKVLFLTFKYQFSTKTCCYRQEIFMRKSKGAHYDNYIHKTKFTSHKQQVLGLGYSRNARKKDTCRPKYTLRFFTLSEKKRFANLQKQQLHKKLLQWVCYWHNLLG